MSEGWRRRSFRHALVGIEIGLATVLLIGAVLVGTSFWNLLNQPLGFDTENVVAAHTYFQPNRGLSEQQLRVFNEELLQRLKRYPQVENASVAMNPPVNFGIMYATYSLEMLRQDVQSGGDQVSPIRVEVSSEYFQTLKIRFTEGRTFSDGEQAVVINESMARRHWPNSSPLGSRIKLAREDQPAPWFTIVGVVVDQNDRLAGWRVDLPRIFRPCAGCFSLLVRTRTESADIGAIIRKEIGAMDNTLPVDSLQTLDDALGQSGMRADPRFRTILFSAFAGTALLLALAGVYGVTSYSAAQRTREIGIRIAMGATRRRLILFMVAQSMVPIVMGIAAGLAGAFALTRFVRSYLFEQSPTNPSVFLAAATALFAVALLANLVPIRRRASADPMTSLRCE
jgi:putative ABC transport system permease protein